jgi:acetyltransferase-like isoleucine patch superfamily enzyme
VKNESMPPKMKNIWMRFWMRHAGMGPLGRMATRLAGWAAPHYKDRAILARMNPVGYIAPSAIIHHGNLTLEGNNYIGDRCVIYESNGGSVDLGRNAKLYSDDIIETGVGGSVTIGADTHVQPRCVLMGYVGKLEIGQRVEIAPHCVFYPYDHGFAPGKPIRDQPLSSRGGIFVGDDVWLGVGVTVLDGVKIYDGAVIGAGAVVTKDVPAEAIACGVPATVVKMRGK